MGSLFGFFFWGSNPIVLCEKEIFGLKINVSVLNLFCPEALLKYLKSGETKKISAVSF